MLTDVRRLRALEAVATRRSFSAAAEDLGYTQSAVSQQIVALEREVGITLVERTVRPVELTEAGRVLLAHTAPVLERLATAAAELDALRGLRAGRLAVAAFPSALATFVPRALAVFTARNPGVEVRLTESEPPGAVGLLRSGRVDLAVVYGWEGDEAADAGLVRRDLGPDLARAVLPAGHRLARRARVRLDQLAGEPWIVPAAGGPAGPYRAVLEGIWEAAGMAPRIAFEADDPAAAQGLAAAGLGIALVNELILAAPHPGVAIRPLAEPIAVRDLAALTVAGRRWPAADELLGLLVAERADPGAPERAQPAAPPPTPGRAGRAAPPGARARR